MKLTFGKIECLVSSGESNSLELKETTGQLSRGMESGCAFMNSATGGYLLFGVNDKGHIIGQEVSDKTKRDIANALKKFEPATYADVQYITVPKTNKQVIVIYFEDRHGRKPYIYEGRAYIKIENTTTVMPQQMYNELLHNQVQYPDWSGQIVKEATIEDLDPKAIATARSLYTSKNKEKAAEIATWDDITFLNKAKITIKGKITNTAIILLGKEKSISNVLKDNAPEEIYRNRFLAIAMLNLQMVDTIGSGIRKMFNFQRQRLFPLPDYNIEDNRIQVTIIGKIVNLEYANILARKADLSLVEIEALNRIQLSHSVSDEEIAYLRKKRLIEGRKSNLFIAKTVAQQLDQKTNYSNNKGFEDGYYCDLIIKALTEHRILTKQEITQLLWKKLPDVLDDDQKHFKVKNLLTKLRKQDKIESTKQSVNARWHLKQN